MVNYEKLIVSPVRLCLEQPKALLPAVLATIPSFLWLALAVSFINKIAAGINRDALYCKLAALFANAGAKTACPSVIGLSKLTGIILAYAPYALGIMVVSIVVTTIVNLAYASLVFQNRRAKAGAQESGVLVSEAFRGASANFGRLIWTVMVFWTLWVMVFAACILVMAALWFMPVIGIAIDVLLGLFLFATIVTGPYLSGLVLTPVVFMEDVSGWNAVKRSMSILRANVVPFIVLMLLSLALYQTISPVLNGVMSSIPVVGFILAYPIELFFMAWASMAPVELYFETVETGIYQKRA